MQAPASPPVSPRWDEFRAGVTACLRSWSALRAAVEGGWGGIESHEKAEFLRETIYGYFSNGLVVTQEDMEDHLAIYLQEEFSVNLEDDSEREVAAVIWQLYETCLVRGTTSLAEQVVASALQASVLAPAFPVQVQSTGDDDDDDDDAMMEDDGTQPATAKIPNVMPTQAPVVTQLPPAAEYAASYLFGEPPTVKATPIPTGPVRQLGETPVEKTPEIEVDDDGFAPVVKRKGGGRR